MNSMRKNRTILTLLTLACAFLLSLTAAVGVQFKKTASANEDVKKVSEITYKMEKGASIYLKDEKLGIRFGAGMSETDYTALMNNVGEGKEYASIKFGVIIAPAYYEDKFGGLDQQNLFSENAVYDWAAWDAAEEEWVYTESDKTRVINIESTSLTVKDGNAMHYGAITTLREHNLLTEFKGVGYIIAETAAGGTEYSFATYNDNTRTVVYVAQMRQQVIKDEIAKLDPTAEAAKIASLQAESETLGKTYITSAVTETDANYTVEYYYEKPDQNGHFLYATETKTAKINTELSANTCGGVSGIAGVTFDEDNANNAADPVVFAQDKSVVKVYYDVTYGKDYDNTEKIYDITATEDYALGDTRVSKLYDSEMKELTTSEGKVDKTLIVAMGKGEHTLYALTANGFEAYSAILATHVIATGEDFVTMLNSYVGTSRTNPDTGEVQNDTAAWYVVLANDIDCGGASVSKAAAARFWGTFNGLGHSVVNVFSNYNGGLFGALQPSSGVGGVIKNTAFEITAMERSVNVALLVGYSFSGTINNVYVKGYYNGLDDYAGVSYETIGNVKNSIFDISYSNSTAAATYIINGSDKGVASNSLMNVYTIGGNSWVSRGSAEKPYADFDSFYTANKANITTEKGFNKYWNATDEGLYFGDMLIKGKQYAESYSFDEEASTWSAKESVTVDVEAILGAAPTKVTLGGTAQTVTDGKITVDTATYAMGMNYPLLIENAEKKVSAPLMIVSHNINTNIKFTKYVASWIANANAYKGTYAVLSANLTNVGGTTGTTTTRFYGTFDGQGYTVSGVIVNHASLFGCPGATGVIKNVAFVDIIATNACALVYNCYNSGAVIENVYARVIMNDNSKYGGAAATVGNSKFNNCIFDVSYFDANTAEVTYAINGYASSASTKLTNVYCLGNADQIQPGDETKPYAAGAFAKAVAEGTIVLDATTGFNSCWSVVTEGNTTTVYFNGNVIDTYTVTE